MDFDHLLVRGQVIKFDNSRPLLNEIIVLVMTDDDPVFLLQNILWFVESPCNCSGNSSEYPLFILDAQVANICCIPFLS